MNKNEKIKPSLLQDLMPIVFMIVALRLGYTWEEMQKAIIEKISNALPATLILWSVGF